MESYRHRIMDDLLKRKLQAKGAVLIEGPKWCGKTTTAEEIAASKVRYKREFQKSFGNRYGHGFGRSCTDAD